MNKFNNKLDDYFDQLLSYSKTITELLEKAKNEKCDVSKEVKSKYLYRREILDNLNNFMQSDEGKEILINKKSAFDKVLNNLVDIDNRNVDLLKNVTQDVKVTMGKINKNKRLMIYSKGAGNEY